MDSGPFSTPQPQDRRATTSRPPEPTYRQDPQPVEESARTVRRAPVPHREPARHTEPKRGFKKFLLPLIIAIVVIALGLGAWLFFSHQDSSLDSVINKDEYQAVFFTNGQVYFGKLETLNSDYLKMTDIYYLQANGDKSDSSNPQQTSDTSGVQLIKLGSEIHGPQDEMAISRDQVLFYENLKPDGKVAQAIEQAKSQK